MRKTAACINCGEPREIAAHGLCFMCYRREKRSDDRIFPVPDRHNPAIRREHKKMFRRFTSVMVGMSDLGVGTADVLAIRWMLEPYVAPIAQFLGAAPEPDESRGAVNSEQNEKLFTVHAARGPRKCREHGDEPDPGDSNGGNAA